VKFEKVAVVTLVAYCMVVIGAFFVLAVAFGFWAMDVIHVLMWGS
jgi:hypothetical protein